jgi:ESS family glutamate:Na+ symporter
VFLIYLITWVVCSWITRLLNATGNNILLGLIPIIWGFNFIWGSQIAVGFRSLIKLGRKIGWITRQYQNSYLLSRIAGYAFDLMIICAICIIDFRDLSGLWLPFVLVCLAGTFGTLFYHKKMCKILYPEYYYEGFMSMYGMQTGVISSGILLLREIDPKFETPAANNLVLGNSWAIGLGAPMLILIAMAPLSDTLLFTVLGICIVYFIILMSYILFVKPKKRD